MTCGTEQTFGGLNMSNKRSLRSKQRRDAKRFISNTSFQDRELAETVAIVNRNAVLTYLGMKYEFVFPDVVNVEKGEVLTDARGRGSFQK